MNYGLVSIIIGARSPSWAKRYPNPKLREQSRNRSKNRITERFLSQFLRVDSIGQIVILFLLIVIS